MIPHLNDLIPLEPSQLSDVAPEELERPDDPADGTRPEANTTTD